jgi:hypothetical protein
MKLRYGNCRKALAKGIAAAATSALLTLSCAANNAFMAPAYPLAEEPIPQMPAEKPPPSSARERGILVSQWTLGRCQLDGNMLSYSDDLGSRHAMLRVDSDVAEASALICSDESSIIILPGKAVISLGGDDIIAGREMLGFMDGRLIAANSVEVNISEAIESGALPQSAALEGHELSFRQPDGRRWRIDVANPFSGWSIY